jgi:hypothetical protein
MMRRHVNSLADIPSLTQRHLNRALLARQHLLSRAALPVDRLVEQLAGVNAQDPQQPYITLWSRLQGFQREQLDGALLQRRLVKGMLMRSTLHMVSTRDFLRIRQTVQPALTRAFRSFFKEQAGRLQVDPLLDAARAFASEQPRTLPEIRDHLLTMAPGEEPACLTFLVRTHLPLVQLPPNGTWGKYGTPAWSTPESWLGRPVDTDTSKGKRRLVLRYLRAFGPATEADLTAWAGFSLSEAVAELEPYLVKFRGPNERILLDLPGMPLPDCDVPAPPRFLPVWDNLLLSHKDRTRVLPEEYRSQVILSGGRVQPTFLVDGFVAGLWRWEQTGGRAQLTLEAFSPLPAEAAERLKAEGLSLLRFLAEEAEHYEVVLRG